MTYLKPLPEADKWSGPFFEGAREGKLLAQRCNTSGRFFFPPSPVSPVTRDGNWSWVELSGKGKIGSYVVMHQKYFPGFGDEVPYPVIEVELEEGVRLLSSIVELGDRELSVGMPVEVVFDKVTDEVTLPKFRPAA
ncbi:Zn-ribbon domain-containing OB-fold protein [Novosphingobium rosa]|uniref:Zn-ribbon domain-containing OB-fold protein n=1 Tax=Novosphingobium rosa TaxID=76978 RepID=UPI00082D958F|nr:Zn-ribbon domain-containing OB-fold protein [Novosphingobium rosa]